MTQGQGGVYHANGGGRDSYITRDPVVYKGISEATPRVQTINAPGMVPRPPSSLARGSKAAGYTGYLPGRVEGIGQNFGKLSEKKDMKTFVPKLRLKHRYIAEPNSERQATSRDYGSFTEREQLDPKPPLGPRGQKSGSVTDRPGFLPKIYDGSSNKPKPYTGYAPSSIIRNAYWKQHVSGKQLPSPRKTQRTQNQDADLAYSEEVSGSPMKTAREIVSIAHIPQGYTGYRPRFRIATGGECA